MNLSEPTVIESDESEDEKPYSFIRSHPSRVSNSSFRESFSDLMKRKIPNVFSSFRSKRRQQIASVQNTPSTFYFDTPKPINGHFNNNEVIESTKFDGKNDDFMDFQQTPKCSTFNFNNSHQRPLHFSASSAQLPETKSPASPSSCCDGQQRLQRSASWLPVTKIHVNGDSCETSSVSATRQPFGSVFTRLSTKSLNSYEPLRVIAITTDEIENSNTRHIEVLHDYHREFSPTTSSSHLPEVGSPTQALAAMELAAHQPSALHRKSSLDFHCSHPGTSKISYVIEELLNTERTYVRELESIVEFYVKPFESPDYASQIPPGLRGQSEMLFGNIRHLFNLHSHFLLPEFARASKSPIEICHILVNNRNRFLDLYRPYCQNKPISEALRRDHNADGCRFFVECQKRAGHQLPLSAYLLKPIQRITKYQLLLREILRFCNEEDSTAEFVHDVQLALDAMLALLVQINNDMQQLHILGYSGDLRLLGALRLQTECEIFTFRRKNRRMTNKAQKRHLFLFDGGVLFCKKRSQPLPQYSPEFYEHKFCIPIATLGFAECSKQAPERFEIWDESKTEGYAVFVIDEVSRGKWIQRLARLTVLTAHRQQKMSNPQSPTKQSKEAQSSRPNSWTSDSTTASSRSSHSNFEDSLCNHDGQHDSNGNPSSASAENESTCTSISSGSRRSSSSHTADHDNNVGSVIATTPLHISKSLQNTASCARELITETAVSEV